MKKIIGAAVVAVGLLVGCSDSGSVQQVGGSDESGGAPGVEATGGGGAAVTGNGGIGTTAQAIISVDLRMRSKNAANYKSLLLVANRIEVFADGKPVTVIPTWNLADLSNMNQAEKLATVLIPADATRVDVRVGMGAAGGFELKNNKSGWVDTRERTVSYTTTLDQVSKNKMSVIEVDASKSFIASKDGEKRTFVPNFRIW